MLSEDELRLLQSYAILQGPFVILLMIIVAPTIRQRSSVLIIIGYVAMQTIAVSNWYLTPSDDVLWTIYWLGYLIFPCLYFFKEKLFFRQLSGQRAMLVHGIIGSLGVLLFGIIGILIMLLVFPLNIV